MKNKLVYFLMVCVMLGLAACGGGDGASGGASLASTVRVNASIKNGESLAVFDSLAAGAGSSTSFTLTSTVLDSLSSITASEVNIKSIQMKYIPMTASDMTMSPALPDPPPIYISTTISPGGSGDIDNVPMMANTVYTYLYNNYYPTLLANAGLTYQYNVVVNFYGIEVLTGKSVNCQAYVTLWVTA